MRTLQRLGLPTLLFVNKVDRAGAGDERVLRAIAERLTPAVVAMGSVHGLGTRAPRFVPYGAGDDAFRARLADLLADHDDALVAAYLDDETALPYRRLRRELAAQTRRALVHPVFFGSAITGARGRGPGRRDHRAAAGRRRRRPRPGLGHGVQGRAGIGHREARLCPAVLGHGRGA